MQEQHEHFLRQHEIEEIYKSRDKRYFMGSPRIGKTTLLQGVIAKLQEDESRCPVRIEWEKDWTASWDDMLLQVSQFFARKRRGRLQVARLVEEFLERPDSRVKFFERLHSESKTDIVLVIDDLDKAESSYDPHKPDHPKGLTPTEVVHLATLPGVSLVATGRQVVSYALRRVFDVEEWLRLPPREVVSKYVCEELKFKGEQDKRLSRIIEWAGYHPFLLRSLLDIVPPGAENKTIKGVIRKWGTSDKVQWFLNETVEYLENQMSKNREVRVVLRQALNGTLGHEPLSVNSRRLVQHLRDYAIIDANQKSFIIPSRLVHQRLREVVVPLPSYDSAQFVIFSIIIVPISIGLYFALLLTERSIPFDPRWAFALMLLPFLHWLLFSLIPLAAHKLRPWIQRSFIDWR